jgi:hypothetical protein
MNSDYIEYIIAFYNDILRSIREHKSINNLNDIEPYLIDFIKDGTIKPTENEKVLLTVNYELTKKTQNILNDIFIKQDLDNEYFTEEEKENEEIERSSFINLFNEDKFFNFLLTLFLILKFFKF